MCGRHIIRHIDLVRYGLGPDVMPKFEEFTEHPRFNFAPGRFGPVIRINSQGGRSGGLAR